MIRNMYTVQAAACRPPCERPSADTWGLDTGGIFGKLTGDWAGKREGNSELGLSCYSEYGILWRYVMMYDDCGRVDETDNSSTGDLRGEQYC